MSVPGDVAHRCTHIQGKANDALPLIFKPTDLNSGPVTHRDTTFDCRAIVCDMNCHPRIVVDTVRPWLAFMAPGSLVIVTFKRFLRKENDTRHDMSEAIEENAEILRRACGHDDKKVNGSIIDGNCCVFEEVRLFHGGVDEVTVIVSNHVGRDRKDPHIYDCCADQLWRQAETPLRKDFPGLPHYEKHQPNPPLRHPEIIKRDEECLKLDPREYRDLWASQHCFGSRLAEMQPPRPSWQDRNKEVINQQGVSDKFDAHPARVSTPELFLNVKPYGCRVFDMNTRQRTGGVWPDEAKLFRDCEWRMASGSVDNGNFTIDYLEKQSQKSNDRRCLSIERWWYGDHCSRACALNCVPSAPALPLRKSSTTDVVRADETQTIHGP